jgi:hypothetical protein
MARLDSNSKRLIAAGIGMTGPVFALAARIGPAAVNFASVAAGCILVSLLVSAHNGDKKRGNQGEATDGRS